MNNKVCAIIVTYNPVISKLENLIFSISNQVAEVIVIDNASLNIKQIEYILSSSNCMLISLSENKGIAEAQNIGIKESLSHDSTHVLLLDQDTALPVNFVVTLLADEQRLISNKLRVGAIGPSFYDKRTMRQYPLAIIDGFSLRKLYLSESQEPVSVSFIIASGSLIRTDVIKDVGGMMDELFIDYVDIEWCLRAISKDYNIFVSSNTKILHEIGDIRKKVFNKDFSIHSAIRNYYISRNGFKLCTLNYIPIKYKLRTLTYTTLRNIMHSFIGGDVFSNLYFTFLGIVHGVFGKTGKLR